MERLWLISINEIFDKSQNLQSKLKLLNLAFIFSHAVKWLVYLEHPLLTGSIFHPSMDK